MVSGLFPLILSVLPLGLGALVSSPMKSSIPRLNSFNQGPFWAGKKSKTIKLSATEKSENAYSESKGEKPEVGFSFSPGGLLFPYQLGISKRLMEVGLLDAKVPIGGASAGALVAATVGCGVDPVAALEGCWRINERCRETGARGYMREALEIELNVILPDDADLRINEREAPVSIGITRLFPYQGEMVTKFESKQDLIDVLLASCCVPFWFDKWPAINCRGMPAVDGFFSVDKEEFGCPPIDAERVIKVAPFPSTFTGIDVSQGTIISPDFNPEFPFSVSDSLLMALNPYSYDALETLYKLGMEDFESWYQTFVPQKDRSIIRNFPAQVLKGVQRFQSNS